jgi:hypothetical protein
MTLDERTVSTVLHRMADEAEWRPGLSGRTVLRARARRFMTVALAVVVLASVAYGGLTMAGAFRRAQPAGPHPLRQKKVETLTVTAQTKVRSGVTDVAVGPHAVWVAGFQMLTRIDPASGRTVTTIPLPGVGDGSSLAVGAGSVWVTASDKGFDGVYRIDRATNRLVDRIHLTGNPQGIASGAGSVWVTRPEAAPGEGNVVRIDPDTDRVLGNPIPVGSGPGPVLYASGAVWVTNTDYGGSVSKIDPNTGSVVKTLRVPDVQAFGAGNLWAVGQDEILRIDIHSGRIIARIALKRAAEVAFAGSRVWAITSPRSKSPTVYLPDHRHPGAVLTIDPASDEISSQSAPYGETPASLAARGSVAWIGDYTKKVLTRVEATER